MTVGVLIDGRHIGDVPGQPAKRPAGFVFDIVLPDLVLAEVLELVDVATGESLLPAPWDMRPIYAFRMTRLSVSGGRIEGQFTVQGLADRLWMECTAGTRHVARGYAERHGAQYRFSVPALSTVPLNQPTHLMPWVAGRPLPNHTIVVNTADVGIAGFVDAVEPGMLSGWAIDLGKPSRRLSVDLLVDGRVVDTVTADQPRPDLAAAGLGDGFSAFRFTIKPVAGFEKPRPVSVVVSGTRLELCNSPVMALPPPALLGYFDRLHGTAAHGWALNRFEPKKPVVVEALCEGRVLARAEAKLFRGDLLDAGMNEGFCAFKIDIGAQLLDLLGKEVAVRVAGTNLMLPGSPKVATQNPNMLRYLRPARGTDPQVLGRLKRMMNHRAAPGSVSIIMPVYNTPRDWLIQALESVRVQWCDRWELVCVNDCSTERHVAQVLEAYAKHDPRIRVLNSPQNLGIARATNLGLRAARADYVAFMDHDDYLEPDAVYHLLRTAKQTGADFIYSDEVTTDENIASIADSKVRPQFSYDYYLSHPYFVHLLCLRRELAYKIGGWDESMAISADVDFVLRILEHARSVAHVPRVLYRWRTHGGSTGHAKKEAVMEATRGAIQRHLDRRGTGATVEDGVWFNQFRVNWPASDGKILIVIPTKNKAKLVRTAVESIEKTADPADYKLVLVDHDSDQRESRAYFAELAERHTVMPYSGPFNYSAINNAAVREHGEGCPFVLFLNNDIEAITPGWLDRMRRLANRVDVGAVGALLLYPDKRIQHAGVILGFNGSAEATFKFEFAYQDDKGTRNLGYNCSLTSVRDWSAVTAACLMMRRSVFDQLGGFDESLVVGFNDVDLCLRARKLGLKVLYDGATVLFHYESATRSQTKQVLHPEDTAIMLARHARILREGDPFYNPNFSSVTQDHTLREDAGCKRFAVRVVALPAGLSGEEPVAVVEEATAPPARKPVRRKALVKAA
jgi:GT2 family glycosyltransferase